MSDIETRAAALIADGVGKIERRLRPAFCRAVMRLAGNALAIATSHDDAAQTHIGLGRQHHQRTQGGGR